MDEFIDNFPEATVKEKLNTGENSINLVPITLERQNADLPEIKTCTTLKYKLGITQSDTIRSSSPSFMQTSCPAAAILVSKHAKAIETKRPDTSLSKSSSPPSPTTRYSTPSPPSPTRRYSTPPLSCHIVPLQPILKCSAPPPFVPSRSTTPVHDAIVENNNSSWRTFGGRALDGPQPSMRNLSSSFHSEYFVHFSKKDGPVESSIIDHTSKNSAIAISERKRVPVVGKSTFVQSKNISLVQGAHSKAVDQHRWPAMKGGKVSNMEFSRSMDFTDRFVKAASFILQSQGFSPARRDPLGDVIIKSSNFVSQHASLEETTEVEHGTNFGINLASSYIQNGKMLSFTNPSRTLSLPSDALCHLSSPICASILSSPASKRTPSPSSIRPSSPSFSSNNKIQICALLPAYSHILDIKKGIKGIEGADMENIHQLQLLYNRELLWYFLNSQTEVALTIQKLAAEEIINNVLNVNSELQGYVTRKKNKIETLKQEMKFDMLLKEQVSYLEEWIGLEGEYSTFLFRTIEALRVSILRLPVTGGARVDVRAVKNAFSSAIDIMQAMGSSVCSLLSRVEGKKNFLRQLSAVATKEKEMLNECRVLLSATTAMKVEECSLRAHILQQLRQNMHILLDYDNCLYKITACRYRNIDI